MLSQFKFLNLFNKRTSVNKRKSKFTFKKIYFYTKIFFMLFFLTYSFLLYTNKLPKFIDFNLKQSYYNLTKKFGLVLENVYLEGQNHTDINAVIDSLHIKTGQPILSIPIENLRKKLQEISWIKYAIVERNFPSTLFIGIIEKTPIAIWQKDNKFYLIDDNGDIIQENNLDKFFNFIVVIGENAPRHAKLIINIVSKDYKLYKNITHAIRVGDRRWNIKFINGLEIKLPEENLELAWNYVIELFNKQNLFGRSVSTIDLRVPNKIYIK